MVDGSLLGNIAREEGGARVAQILQIAAPKDEVPAVRGEAVIRASNENIIIIAGRRAENEACVIQSITGEKIVGNRLPRAKGLIQIASVTDEVEHEGINPNAT